MDKNLKFKYYTFDSSKHFNVIRFMGTYEIV